MKEIILTKGFVAIVDDEDFEFLNEFKWTYNIGYACTHKKGQKNYIYMHRLIMNAKKGFVVDHINHNSIDNRKENLRVCTHKDNIRNSKSTKNSTSKYLGVSWANRERRWRSVITVDSKQKYLGVYKTEEAASLAYNEASIKYFGEFANLNIIPLK